MSDTTSSGGLAGLVGRLARKSKSIITQSDAIALQLVLFAGVITIVKKNATPDDPWSYAAWFGITLGVAALLYEMSSAKAIARAFYLGKPGALAASAFIWVCAFGYSVNNWVGAASQSQAEKTNIHRTAFLNNQDVRKELSDADAKVARLSDERNLMKPKTSVAAARATIKTSEAHKFFRSTDACKTTKGPQTRAFCDAYASAVADVALWDQIARQEIALADAESDAKDARAKAAGTKVETSESRSDLVILTKYAGLSEEDAQLFNGLGAIIAISIFLSFGSMRAEFERLAALGKRNKFNIMLALRRTYYHWVHGKEPPGVTVQHNHYGTQDGLSAARVQDLIAKHGLATA